MKTKKLTSSFNSRYSDWSTKSRLQLTILNFWTKFTQKWLFLVKKRKSEHHLDFCIFEIAQTPNLSLKWEFWFLDLILTKRVFLLWNRKIVLLHSSMVNTYYIKHFCMRGGRRNSFLMSLNLLHNVHWGIKSRQKHQTLY